MPHKSIKNDGLFYEISSVGRNAVGNQHYHDFFEIYYLEDGLCHYFIDDKVYEVQKGDVVLIPKGIIHKTMYGDSTHNRRLLYFSTRYIPDELRSRLPSLPYLYRNRELSDHIHRMLDAIAEEQRSGKDFSEEIVRHHVCLLLYMLARHSKNDMPRPVGNAYATETVAYIKSHYAENLRLSALARRCSVSPEHLSRLFRREIGFGISEYISMVRLQNAQRLLLTDRSHSVAEIAELCGFNDSNYFSAQFKRALGVSPNRYRKMGGTSDGEPQT